MYLIIIYPHR